MVSLGFVIKCIPTLDWGHCIATTPQIVNL
jgi:hypothetical protein